MKVGFKHPEGVECVIECESLPRSGEHLTLRWRRSDDTREEQTFVVENVHHTWGAGQLATRGGSTAFYEESVVVELGSRVT